jgi:hypothetical protein
MKHRDTQDLAGGLLLSALGLFVALYAQQYDPGTPARMGPGFFPQVLGWLLAGLGLLVALPAWFRRGNAGLDLQWRNFFLVLGAIVLFALTLQPLGLLLATFASALLASLAERGFSWRGRLLTAAGVAVLTAAVFIGGLSMSLHLWPAALRG